MSLRKKIKNSRLGFQGETPTSYSQQIFNRIIGNMLFIDRVTNSGTTSPSPETAEIELITEDNLMLVTENNISLIIE